MKKETYCLLETYMLSYMEDSAHDKEHIYRVLYYALEIAKWETNINYDILITACLFHDIGRREQFENPELCHAMVGGEKASRFLLAHGFDEQYARRVKECIETHRYRKGKEPDSIEAKILFDADKLDVSGAVGIARTLIYVGEVSKPLYSLLPDGSVSDGTKDSEPSFLQEYQYKLKNLYCHFYTIRGKEMALERQQAAVLFYENILKEINASYKNGTRELKKILEDF